MVEDPSAGGPPPPAPGPPLWPQPPPPPWSPSPPPGSSPVPPGWTVPGPVVPGYPGVAKTNGLAIASLVLGCVALALCFVPSILAIVFGYISKSQIDQSHGAQTGRGLAVAGIVLGWIGVGLALLLAIALLLGALAGSADSVDTHNGIETLRVLVHDTRFV